MTLIDFFIGLTLMNAMLHSVLGYWKGRMLTPFGYGNIQNIVYGFLNMVISLGLFINTYGLRELINNGIYAGAITVLLILLVFGRLLYRLFNRAEDTSRH